MDINWADLPPLLNIPLNAPSLPRKTSGYDTVHRTHLFGKFISIFHFASISIHCALITPKRRALVKYLNFILIICAQHTQQALPIWVVCWYSYQLYSCRHTNKCYHDSFILLYAHTHSTSTYTSHAHTFLSVAIYQDYVPAHTFNLFIQIITIIFNTFDCCWALYDCIPNFFRAGI